MTLYKPNKFRIVGKCGYCGSTRWLTIIHRASDNKLVISCNDCRSTEKFGNIIDITGPNLIPFPKEE